MKSLLSMGRQFVFALPFIIAFSIRAQEKPPVPPAEYGKWEMLDLAGELSPDGKWLAYGVRRANGNNELRVSALAGGSSQAAAFGERPAFSADSQWLAYSIGIHEDERAKLTKQKKPVRNKLGFMKLATGEVTLFEGIESFAFGRAGAFLAMRHYPPEKPAAAQPAEGAAEPPADPLGSTLLVRNLAAGTDSTFGSVSQYAWQDKGSLLAMIINAEGKSGNGIQVFDAASGSLRVLDSGPAIYAGLSWRKDSSDLAALRAKTDDKFEDETCLVLAFKDARDKFTYDPAGDPQFPAGKRILKLRAPLWSEDGATVFVGLVEWEKKLPPPTKKNEEEPSGVEVWHTRDIRIMPEQKLRASRDRQRSSVAAWHIASGRLAPLSENPEEEIRPLKNSAWALGFDAKPYETETAFGRPYWNVWRIELATGKREKLVDRLEFAPRSQASPSGRYWAYLKDNHYWLCDIAAGTHRDLTASLGTSLVDRENDHPAPHKPPYGIAGWTKDDRSVIVYDQYDLWELFPDGAKPRLLTQGAPEQTEHRYIRLDPQEEFLDPAKPLYLSVRGRWTKRSGIARLHNGQAERLLWLDKQVGPLKKAKEADLYVYAVQAFDDSPDYFASGPDLKGARQVSETNMFQSQYAWGRAELIEYRSPRGDRLQGALYYPAGYQPGKQYPMIVNIYEILSPSLHRYAPLTDRGPYNASVFTSLGYFVLLPDIVFRPREPGRSIVECVTAAVKKVLEKGAVDGRRVGLVGHSWGGYGTAFTVTQTDLFAAAVAGAPLTNLSSSYGEIYWNNGLPETNHAETGQERMEVPLYEDPQAYIRNSATFFADKMKTPLLLAHGDKDGACDWGQSIELYNVARRAGKQVVLLVYPGENHSLGTKPNQLDYHRRIREWFGHYLKGEPAPEWITRGTSYLERQKELKRLKEAKPTPTS